MKPNQPIKNQCKSCRLTPKQTGKWTVTDHESGVAVWWRDRPNPHPIPVTIPDVVDTDKPQWNPPWIFIALFIILVINFYLTQP
jgi:hypothetical protein